MKKVVWLQIFRGNEILYRADGSIKNENQIVKLAHGNIEWFNYIKLLSGAGLCVVKVKKVLIKKGGELVEVDIPDELIEEVRLAHEGNNTVVLTEEQQKIDDLEKTNKKMQEQLASLMANMELSSNGVDKKDEVKKPPVKGWDDLDIKELRDVYKEKFGKRAFNGWKEDKIKEKLAE